MKKISTFKWIKKIRYNTIEIEIKLKKTILKHDFGLAVDIVFEGI